MLQALRELPLQQKQKAETVDPSSGSVRFVGLLRSGCASLPMSHGLRLAVLPEI